MLYPIIDEIVLQGHAGLFSVVDSECFTLADPSLVSADGSCHTQAIILDEDNPDRELDDVWLFPAIWMEDKGP